MKSFVKVVAVALASVVATGAVAQTFESYGTREGWNIFQNTSTGGCFMERETEEGIVLQIGSVLTMTGAGGAEDYGYLGIFVPGEAPEVSDDTPLMLVESGPNTYIGQALGVAKDGYWGGYIVSSADGDLAWDLLNRKTIKGISANGGMFSLNLKRTNIRFALDEVRECQSQS